MFLEMQFGKINQTPRKKCTLYR